MPQAQATPANAARQRVGTDIEAVADLAVKAQQAGNLPLAERLYGQVLLENPQHANSLHNLGAIRLARDDTAVAIELIEAALRIDPQRPMFHCTLGSALQAAGDHLRAEQACRRALQLKPEYAAAWANLGVTLRTLDRFEEAAAALQRAVEIDPASRPAALNLCNVLMDLGQADQAGEIYHRLLDRNPLDADCAVAYAALELSRRDPAGWNGYARGHWSPEWLKRDPPVMVPLPQWDGESLQDKALLLYGDQGIGDEIMFASLATGAAQQAARTVLLCEPRLAPLFARSFPGIRVGSLPQRTQPPLLHADTTCDLRCSLSRLAGITGLTERADGGASYLLADAARVEHWRGRMAELGPGLKIGVSWRGGAGGRTRSMRSLSLSALQPLFEIPEVHFVDIQYGAHGEEIAAFNAGKLEPLHGFAEVDPLHDMDDFAALLSALDLVISVDNSTVHLAGALGVNSWMLCPFNPSWRWGRQGDSTHWYRSLRLFRQTRPEHTAWQPVIETIADELRKLAMAATPRPASSLQHAPGASAAALPATDLLAAHPDVLLLNDTSWWYHWGCTGTSLALHEGFRAAGRVVDSLAVSSVNRIGPLPVGGADLDDEDLFTRFCERNAPLVQRIQSVREVILNGEGSLHGRGRTARALLYLAWLAKRRFGKRTSIINHSCYPAGNKADATADDLYSRVYRIMDFVAVREDRSAQQLRRLGVEATQAFDCLPLFIAAHPARHAIQRERRLLLAGSVIQHPALIDLQVALAEQALSMGYAVHALAGASAWLAADDVQWMAALHPRLRGRYTLVAATSERQWLDAIAGSALLASGRFHHSIAAACLGTPFLVTASNTCKIDGLIERLGLQRDAVWMPAEDPAGACQRMVALLGNPGPALVPESRLAALRDLARRNFLGLGKPA